MIIIIEFKDDITKEVKQCSTGLARFDVIILRLASSHHVIRPSKGRFCDNSEIDTQISKRLSVENKAKLSQLEFVNK